MYSAPTVTKDENKMDQRDVADSASGNEDAIKLEQIQQLLKSLSAGKIM